jgi:hypothetical protein
MLKFLAWAVPLLVSVLLIQVTSDVLYVLALEQKTAPLEEKQRLPVHVIDREASSGSIIT